LKSFSAMKLIKDKTAYWFQLEWTCDNAYNYSSSL